MPRTGRSPHLLTGIGLGLLVAATMACNDVNDPIADDDVGDDDSVADDDTAADDDTTSDDDTHGDDDTADLPWNEQHDPSQAASRIVGTSWVMESGHQVSGAGDLDGDGHADVLVGDPNADWGNAGSGAVVAFSAASMVASSTVEVTVDYHVHLQALAYVEGEGAVTEAGDLDGDGHADIVAASRCGRHGGYDCGQGTVYAWYGGFPTPGTDLVTSAPDAEVQLGEAVDLPVLASGQDVDGDGLQDVAVGYVDDEGYRGAVKVLCGPSLDVCGHLIGVADHDRAGQGLDLVPDTDGDGLADLLVGSPQVVDGAGGGRAYLILDLYAGGESLTVADHVIEADPADHRLVGEQAASAGDVDGDGLADLLVAGRRGPWDAYTAAVVHLFLAADLGAPGTVDFASAHAVFEVPEPYPLTLDGGGDVDGDGLGDALVGAPYSGGGAGQVFVLLGAALQALPAFDPTQVNHVFTGPVGSSHALGTSLAFAGDVDGDGLDDLLLGAPDAGVAGETYLFTW